MAGVGLANVAVKKKMAIAIAWPYVVAYVVAMTFQFNVLYHFQAATPYQAAQSHVKP
jgi:hypothetical protein